MLTNPIREKIFSLRDEKYKAFQSRIIPSVESAKIIGVRTPELRRLAREMATAGAADFLRELPHEYFEENQLHAFIISGIKDFDECIREAERFLPFADNWATTDQLTPAVFKLHTDDLLPYAKRWIADEKPYTVRFGIKVLMDYYLGDAFCSEYPALVAKIRSGEYYVNMMIAWYFATALAKQYDAVLPFLQGGALDKWTHNKAIQKARESFRLSDEKKEYLKTLKRLK